MVASWIPGVVLLYMGMSAFFSQELGLLELGVLICELLGE